MKNNRNLNKNKKPLLKTLGHRKQNLLDLNNDYISSHENESSFNDDFGPT
jgi:hypothetical protein